MSQRDGAAGGLTDTKHDAETASESHFAHTCERLTATNRRTSCFHMAHCECASSGRLCVKRAADPRLMRGQTPPLPSVLSFPGVEKRRPIRGDEAVSHGASGLHAVEREELAVCVCVCVCAALGRKTVTTVDGGLRLSHTTTPKHTQGT